MHVLRRRGDARFGPPLFTHLAPEFHRLLRGRVDHRRILPERCVTRIIGIVAAASPQHHRNPAARINASIAISSSSGAPPATDQRRLSARCTMMPSTKPTWRTAISLKERSMVAWDRRIIASGGGRLVEAPIESPRRPKVCFARCAKDWLALLVPRPQPRPAAPYHHPQRI